MKKHDLLDELVTEKIIGAAIEVHRTLGPGFLESVYHNALKKEFVLQQIPFETEKDVKIFYKDDFVGEHRLDLFVYKKIVVELKTVKKILNVHKSQVSSYLRATDSEIGLILNFSKSTLDIRRVISTIKNKQKNSWSYTHPPLFLRGNTEERKNGRISRLRF